MKTTPIMGPIASYQATLAQMPAAKGVLQNADRYVLAGVHEGAKLVHKATKLSPVKLAKMINIASHSVATAAVMFNWLESNPYKTLAIAGIMYGAYRYQKSSIDNASMMIAFKRSIKFDFNVNLDENYKYRSSRVSMAGLLSALAVYDLGRSGSSLDLAIAIATNLPFASYWLTSYLVESENLLTSQSKNSLDRE